MRLMGLLSALLWCAVATGQKMAVKTVTETKDQSILEYQVLKKTPSVKHGNYSEKVGSFLVEKGQYNQGKKDGEWLYYDLGRLTKSAIFDMDRKIKRSTFKGDFKISLAKTINYEQSQIEAYSEVYYNDTIVSGFYKGDAKDGKWTYYLPWGKYLEAHYDGGEKHGRETCWIQGNRQWQKQYTKGELDGDCLTFWPEGDVVKYRNFYVRGKINGPFIENYENGKTRLKGTLIGEKHQGKLLGFYKNGQPRFDMAYTDGQLNGPFKLYLDNGSLMLDGSFAMGKLSGLTQAWSSDKEASEKTQVKNGTGAVELYGLDQKLQARFIYEAGQLNGIQTTYGKDEHVFLKAKYKAGKPDGYRTTYSFDGNISAEGSCESGYRVGLWKEVSRGTSTEKNYQKKDSVNCKDNLGEIAEQFYFPPERIFKGYHESVIVTVSEEMPQFYGGEQAKSDYLRSEVNYPKKERDNNVQGMSFVQFTVTSLGDIEDVRIYPGTESKGTENMHKEAIRVVEEMPRWIPGFQRGQPVKVSYSLPLRFKLR